MIYLDNASTKKPSKAAREAFLSHIDEYGNPSNSHSLGDRSRMLLKTARCGILELLGGDKDDDIIFTSGGSEANNLAISTARNIGLLQNKKKIVISAIEHDSVYVPARALERDGFEIVTVPVTTDGVIKAESIARAVDESTALVSVMTVNNELGTVQPIGEIGRICREKGVAFHTDAVASVGHIKTDVARDNVDMLSLSAHKFGGFKGVGGLYVKNGIPVYPMILGGNQQNGLRAGTENILGIYTAYEALSDKDKNIESNREKVFRLRQMLTDGINKIPECVLNGKSDRRFPYTVNLSLNGINSDAMLMLLDESGVCASSGAACHSGERSPSRVLLSLGIEYGLAVDRIRFSLSEDNTESEISLVIDKLSEIIKKLK